MSRIKHKIVLAAPANSHETGSGRYQYLLNYLHDYYEVKFIAPDPIKKNKLFTWFNRAVQIRNYRKLLLNMVKSFDPDLLHLTSPFQIGKVGCEIAAVFEIPYIYDAFQLLEFETAGNLNPHKLKKLQEQETTLLYYAERIVTPNEKIRQQIINRGIEPNKISLIPNGVDASKISPSNQTKNANLIQKYQLQDKKIIGFLNIPSTDAGKQWQIQLMLELAQQIPDLKFLLSGNDFDIQNLLYAVQSVNLSDKVVPAFQYDLLPSSEIYNLMDLVISPPIDELSNLRDVILEVMLLGKNILAAEQSGISELIQNGVTGFLFQYENIENLVTKCITLLHRDTLRLKIGQAARSWVQQHHDWKPLLENYHTIYEQILTK